MKKIILFVSLVWASGILMTNVYNSLIDAKSWGSDIPNSILAARQYFKTVDPGDFYRVFSPINQVLGLLSVILFWKAGRNIRLVLIGAFVLYFAADMFTFAYFYPRNDIMFREAMDLEKIRNAWEGWTTMNWLRTLMVAAGVFGTAFSLNAVYARRIVSKVSSQRLAA